PCRTGRVKGFSTGRTCPLPDRFGEQSRSRSSTIAKTVSKRARIGTVGDGRKRTDDGGPTCQWHGGSVKTSPGYARRATCPRRNWPPRQGGGGDPVPGIARGDREHPR